MSAQPMSETRTGPGSGPERIKVARQVVEALRDMGVRHVFGVPSGGWVDYMEAMRVTDGIDFVLTTHEGTAAIMADVCGRLNGAPGVCFGTFGPGATNLSTGVGGALLDRSPLIALTDEMQAAMRGRVTQMGIDHQALFAPITKKTTRLEPDKVREILFDAAAVALSGRPGSVHVGLPVGMSAEYSPPHTDFALPQASDVSDAPVAAIRQMQAALQAARRPVLALGLGAVRAGVGDEISRFAEEHHIPVVITPMAKGMIAEDHPCYAGVLFHALSDHVGKTHQQSDLVVLIGYDPVEFNVESWAPNVRVINVDDQPLDLDRSVYPDVIEVTGSILSSVAALCATEMAEKDWDMEALKARRQAMFERLKGVDEFGPCAVLDVLREVLPQDGIMTCDVGAHTHLIGQKWPTPAPGRQIMTNGWSTMGFGIPAAIAAKLCRPDVDVCTVVGDGGFLMSAGELATAVRLGLPIVTIVITDNDLALIRIKQQKKQNPIYGTAIRARGTIGGDNIFGVPVLTASERNAFRVALKKAFAAGGPMIVEALVSSREYDELVLKKDKPN
ncbi:thiamine pyrophosphate-binding protein [Mesorhizobium sp.]|uniref:thiamine pyrophosphate-binding protein n=1 Tax=Mesorhizobium sp. TaxID=1871066 RepID=UPI0025B9C854|nr:thiamine pyrophosphate-binding protein [Mesorhizobium sp.]